MSADKSAVFKEPVSAKALITEQRSCFFWTKACHNTEDAPENPVFVPQDQNVFDSKKKVKLTNAEGVEYKLAKKQLQAIDFNKALLAMYTNQVTDRI